MTILAEFDLLPRWGEPDPERRRERFLEAHRDVLRRLLEAFGDMDNRALCLLLDGISHVRDRAKNRMDWEAVERCDHMRRPLMRGKRYIGSEIVDCEAVR